MIQLYTASGNCKDSAIQLALEAEVNEKESQPSAADVQEPHIDAKHEDREIVIIE